MIKYIKVLILLFAGTTVLFTSCKHDRNQPGYAYMPDMYYSEPYNAYTENPVFNDSLTMQAPAEGSIPRGHIPYPYKPKNYTDQLLAGQELMNPLEANDENLAIGKKKYDVFCASCHGVMGKGDGYLYTSKKFAAKPTSLVEAYVQGKPDGELYHIITVGSLSGLMGAHGAQISPDDRWTIINYVRKLAQ